MRLYESDPIAVTFLRAVSLAGYGIAPVALIDR